MTNTLGIPFVVVARTAHVCNDTCFHLTSVCSLYTATLILLLRWQSLSISYSICVYILLFLCCCCRRSHERSEKQQNHHLPNVFRTFCVFMPFTFIKCCAKQQPMAHTENAPTFGRLWLFRSLIPPSFLCISFRASFSICFFFCCCSCCNTMFFSVAGSQMPCVATLSLLFYHTHYISFRLCTFAYPAL